MPRPTLQTGRFSRKTASDSTVSVQGPAESARPRMLVKGPVFVGTAGREGCSFETKRRCVLIGWRGRTYDTRLMGAQT